MSHNEIRALITLIDDPDETIYSQVRERIVQMFRTFEASESPERWAERTRERVERHTGSKELQDDLTLLFLRRR